MAAGRLLRALLGLTRVPEVRGPALSRRPGPRPRAGAAALLLFLFALFLLPAPAGAEIRAPLGGLLPAPPGTLEQWSWSGAWRFPVGDPRDYLSAGAAGCVYKLLRSVGSPGESGGHQGADIGCGRAGGEVVAAAAGLVILADREVGSSGYGRRVVIAHRLPDGRVAYSVYAHLAEGSIPVRAGQRVAAGQRVGRVGQSGRASTPHLHFEIRLASSTDVRWEKEPVTDPIAFVATRLAETAPADSLGGYLEWAQYASLTGRAPRADEPIRAADWWRMLAVATCTFLEAVPEDPADLADSLIAAGVLRKGDRRDPEATIGWKDVRRDLRRARDIGLRLPERPVATEAHREACERWLGAADPDDAKLAGSPPTLGAAILVVADLAPPRAAPRRKGGRGRPEPEPTAGAPEFASPQD